MLDILVFTELFQELKIELPKYDNNENITNCQTFLTNGDFINYYQPLITPILFSKIYKRI